MLLLPIEKAEGLLFDKSVIGAYSQSGSVTVEVVSNLHVAFSAWTQLKFYENSRRYDYQVQLTTISGSVFPLVKSVFE